jgi:hypothetical protein
MPFKNKQGQAEERKDPIREVWEVNMLNMPFHNKLGQALHFIKEQFLSFSFL